MTDHYLDATERQAAMRERLKRGALLRREEADLEFMASESPVPYELLVVAYRARLAAVRADPNISSITETEAMIHAVLEYQEGAKSSVIDTEERAARRRAVKQLMSDLEWPKPKNAAVAESNARLLGRLQRYVIDEEDR